MAVNPLVELRRSRGWTRRDLALALGVSYGTLWQAEAGLPRTLLRSISQGLARIGADAQSLATRYEEWRRQLSWAVASN